MAKRPYLDAARMRPIYEKYERSGQTIKAFCVSEGLNVHTFQYWRLKFLKEVSPVVNSFQQVHPTPTKPTCSLAVIKIRLPDDIEIDLPMDYDLVALQQLIQGLRC